MTRKSCSKLQFGYSSLEPRQLLASVSLESGLLKIVGTSGDDSVSLEITNGGDIAVLDDEVSIGTFTRSDITGIEFHGLAGNDRFEYVQKNVAIVPLETSTEVAGLSIISRDIVFENLESVKFFGGNGDDTLNLSFGATTSRAVGFVGADVLGIGGEGDDDMYADLSQFFTLGIGVTFYGNQGNDMLRGGAGNDELVGGDGDDVISGNAGADIIRGGSGDDVLSGGFGADQLFGNEGDDVMTDEEEFDTFGAGSPGNDFMHGGSGNDILKGGHGDDKLYGDDGADMIEGGRGVDELHGWYGHDSLIGGTGEDKLYGGFGNDLMYGDLDSSELIPVAEISLTTNEPAGADTLVGGAGDDVLHGGDKDDRLIGSNGNDRIFGGDGDDFITGNMGFDFLYGGWGADSLHGGEGNDFITGGVGNDVLCGNSGNDRLFGEAGDDRMFGHEGADLLHGNEGNDYLSGGPLQRDTLYGHFGQDTFVQIVDGESELDVFIDFAENVDKKVDMNLTL